MIPFSRITSGNLASTHAPDPAAAVARIHPVWDHVGISVSDRRASRQFYESLLGALGYDITHPGEHFDEWNDFGIAQASSERPTTRHLPRRVRRPVPRRRGCLLADGRRRRLRERRRTGRAAAVLPRLLRRPSCSTRTATAPRRSTRESRAPATTSSTTFGSGSPTSLRRDGSTRRSHRSSASTSPPDPPERERFHVFGGGRSFGLVHDGRPATEHVHLAFGVPDNATVDEFHRAGDGRRLPRQRPRPASGPSTTRATTAPSSSTRTETTSRPSATTGAASARPTRARSPSASGRCLRRSS